MPEFPKDYGLHRLGNLALLTPRDNRTISNKVNYCQGLVPLCKTFAYEQSLWELVSGS